MKVELDLSGYATKADLKNVVAVDTSGFAEKLISLIWKSDIDESDIGKLKGVPSNLSNSKSNDDEAELYLILQPLYYTLKRLPYTEKLYHGNLKECQPQNLLLLSLLIIVFLHQLNGMKIQILFNI